MQESVTEERWKYLGGSDIPAVMGISPFTTRFDLLKYKAQLAENDFQGNEYTEYGNVMESKIRDYINAGCNAGKYVEDKVIKETEGIDWRYHADGYNEKLADVLEIKTTSQIHSTVDEYKIYLVQLLFGMYIHNAPNGMLAVYERPEDMSTEFDEDRLQIFDIDMDHNCLLLAEILHEIELFDEDLEYLKKNPDAEEYMLPSRAELLDLSDSEWQVADKRFKAMFLLSHEKEITEAIKQVKDKLKESMELHNIKSARFEDGTLVSYVPSKGASTKDAFDEKAFAKDYPDLYQQYLVTKQVKGKASYVTVRHTND